MSLYLLDTNMVSFIYNNRSPAARARLEEIADQQLAVSAITEGELWFGLARNPNPRRQQALGLFLAAFKILPWDSQAAAVYGLVRARQERIGRKLGPQDTQIAAHAVALGATLVSHDTDFDSLVGATFLYTNYEKTVSRNFAIGGLEDWATDL